jgi:protoporphyrinogen/coproporphyrinogen III oxidase
MRAVVVIGAGAAGLSAALALRDRGASVTLLEAGPRPGGKIGTIREGGFLLESGAIGILDRDGELDALCLRLGLTLVPARADATERWVLRSGRVHALPASLPGLVGTGLLSLREKLGLAGEPFRPRGRSGRANGSDGREGEEGQESLHAFFTRRLGPGGAFLAAALQTGIYAGDSTRLEAAACFPSIVQMEREHGSLTLGARAAVRDRLRARRAAGARRAARLASFSGGLAELVLAIAREVGPSLHTDARVRALHREGAGYRLEVERGRTVEELHTDAVVVALPGAQAAALVEPLDGALAARLAEISTAPVSLVHVGVRAAELARPLRGFGLLAPGEPVLGTLFPSLLWAGRAPEGALLLSSLVGGALHPQAAQLPDESLVRLVREALAQTCGLPAAAPVLLTRIVRWSEAIPQYTLGHGARVEAIDRLTAGHPGLALAGASLHGVSIPDCLRDGRRAAAAVHPD